ncbi:hypothetical protein GJU40_10745 [Bacillus lacus]|uniref:YqgU-like 6-bladed beta-propeller domain-containing protein n=1 Tax=Metabacillus lacus TaxID=1983721 RepID=A0A7X2IZT5_9BACI|nr:hypothetical protein [Metabacillus lacus]MRX72624.1 hypothetical protein [Metabacillus lacus]
MRTLFPLFLLLLLVTACQPHQPQETDSKLLKPSKNVSPEIVEEKTPDDILPLGEKEGVYTAVEGWYDEETVIVTETAGEHTHVQLYNLYNGSRKTFYESDSPVTEIQRSREGSLFLIQRSTAESEADILLLNRDGDILFQQAFPSFDLQISWNSYKENLFYATVFQKDWSFQSFIIDVYEEKVFNSPLQVPFAEWNGEDTFSYIEWDQESRSSHAPLLVYDLQSGTQKQLSGSAAAQKNAGDLLIAAELKDEEAGIGSFHFFQGETEKLTLKLELNFQRMYEEWSPPEFIFDDKANTFYTFFESVSGQYDLIGVNTLNGQKNVVLHDAEPGKLVLSPSGKSILSGPGLNQMIHLSSGTLVPLIQYSQHH